MTPEELFARATDPRQYDAGLDWPRVGFAGSPTSRFYQAWLEPELERLRPRAAVDIGCGTGHLFALLRAHGARRVTGIEPSATNAATARRAFPDLELIEAPLQQVASAPAFEVAVAVMSFEHQPDLGAAFRAVRGLLVPGGTFLLVAGDPAFHLAPRFDLGIEAHPRPDGSLLVATTYAYGTVHDVIRPPEHYEDAARAAGFAPRRRHALTPTPDLIATDRRWQEFEGRAIGHLFVLESP